MTVRPTSPFRKKTLLGAARCYSPRRLVLLVLLIACGIFFVTMALPPKPKPKTLPELNQAPTFVQRHEARKESLQVESLHASRRDVMCRVLNEPLVQAWRGRLPQRLLMSVAVGYNYESLRLLTNSFLHVANGVSNVTERLGLVFFVKDVPEDWPIVDDRIFFVRTTLEEEEKGSDRPAVHTRFTQYKCFIEALGLQNDTRIFTLDARDSVLQRNPFVYPDDGRLRFFYESGIIKDVWCNYDWLQSCSSPEFAEYYSGTRIVNDGTIYGTAGLLARYFAWFGTKIFSIETCNDQGLHIYAVVSGDLRGIVNFRMEDNEWGSVLSAHAAHKLVYLNDLDEICSKVTNEPYAIAHQYDRIDHVRDQVTRRFWLPPKGTQLIRELPPMAVPAQ